MAALLATVDLGLSDERVQLAAAFVAAGGTLVARSGMPDGGERDFSIGAGVLGASWWRRSTFRNLATFAGP